VRRIFLAAAACLICASVASAADAPPPTPQETERRCHDYTLHADDQIAACTRIMGLYGTATANQGLLAIAYLARGSAHYRKGELGPASSDFRQAIEIDTMAIASGQPEAAQYNERCWARAVAMIELNEALRDCNEALRLMPSSVDALDSRAFLQLRRARFRDALADYDAALKANPMDTYSLYGRGVAKKRTGDADGATADIMAATSAQQGIAAEFLSYGITP